MSEVIVKAFIEKLAAITTLESADELFTQTLGELGCEYFTYTYYNSDFHSTRLIKHELSSQFLKDWHVHFAEAGYESIDTVGKKVKNGLVPIAWNLEDELNKATKEQKILFSEALDYGLYNGISFPIFEPNGAMAIIVIHQLKRGKTIGFNLQMAIYQVSIHYHQRIAQLLKNQQPMPACKLTKRQQQCLVLTARNKSAKEIAKILNVSLRTVAFHIETANAKLGARNKYQSVAKALQLGLIDPAILSASIK